MKLESRIFLCPDSIYLKCIAFTMCPRERDAEGATDGEEERCCTGAWQVGYYNNEDGCVYHELCIPFQSPPHHTHTHILLLLLLFHSLAHLSSSACVLQLVDQDIILTLQPRCYSLSCEEGVFWCVCVYSSSSSPLKATTPPLWLRPGLEIMG